ncbi:MAG: hypothetical protein IPP90_19985 [Gemmatimonadaceae bacterium]|nr:hypothetical protein [Gemmatimonadaceae bacterium]
MAGNGFAHAVSSARRSPIGASRSCPHCRQTILESASVCPACRKHLRFEATKDEVVRAGLREVALRVEGTVEHAADMTPWEYSVLISVTDERGVEVARHVVSVGALLGGSKRSFAVSVEVFKP